MAVRRAKRGIGMFGLKSECETFYCLNTILTIPLFTFNAGLLDLTGIWCAVCVQIAKNQIRKVVSMRTILILGLCVLGIGCSAISTFAQSEIRIDGSTTVGPIVDAFDEFVPVKRFVEWSGGGF